MQAFTYDDEGRIKTVHFGTASDADLAQYEYDGRGNLVRELIPVAGREVRYDYDALGRLVEKEVASSMDGTVVSRIVHHYDDIGRIAMVCDELDGSPSTFCEAPLTEGEAIYYYDTKGAYAGTVSYLTDNNQAGRLAYVEDATGAIFYEYDALGRVTTVARHEGALSSWSTSKLAPVHYVFDGYGNVKTLQYPSGRRVTYDYGDDPDGPTLAPTAVWVDMSTTGSDTYTPVLDAATYVAGASTE